MGVIGTTPLLLLAAAASPLPAQQTSAYEELQAFSGVLNYIRLNYPDTVAYSKLVHAAIDGVLHTLDPHSAFYSRLESSVARRSSVASWAGPASPSRRWTAP